MLLGFQVSNHRSFLGQTDFSMTAVDKDRSATRRFERLPEPVLTVSGIYGPNASGKSNFLHAIAWLSNAVRRSLRSWDEFVPRDPHLIGDGPARPSVFDIAVVVDEVEYEYRLVVDDSAVLYESLHGYPERRRRRLFERHNGEIEFRRGLAGARGVESVLTSTTLALSSAMRFGMPDVGIVGRAIAGIRSLGIRSLGAGFYPYFDSTQRLFAAESEGRQLTLVGMPTDRPVALDLLRWADPGIADVEFIPLGENEDQPARGSVSGSRRQLQFVRRVADADYSLSFDKESAGTKTWFRLLGPALGALGRGQVLLFDEIDASLHPRLSSQLIQLFQDPVSNPLNAQLVFTTHDTSLLNVLNRDEVWLTEKGTDGSSELVALAEYGSERVRKSLNLERAYLQGRFGAIPEPDQIMIRQALGLALGDK